MPIWYRPYRPSADPGLSTGTGNPGIFYEMFRYQVLPYYLIPCDFPPINVWC